MPAYSSTPNPSRTLHHLLGVFGRRGTSDWGFSVEAYSLGQCCHGHLQFTGHQVHVDGDRGHRPGLRRGQHGGAHVRDIAGSPHSRNRGLAHLIGLNGLAEGGGHRYQPKPGQELRPDQDPGLDRQGLDRMPAAVFEFKVSDGVVLAVNGGHGTGDHGNSAGGQLLKFELGWLRCAVDEQGDVGGPLAEQQRLMDGEAAAADHPNVLVADLPAMAERAMRHILAPVLGKSWDVREFIDDAGGDQEPFAAVGAAIAERDAEFTVELFYPQDPALNNVHVVGFQIGPAQPGQLEGSNAVARDEAMGASGGCVARLAGIDHGDRAAGAPQNESRIESGRAAANDDYVLHDVHLLLGVFGLSSVRRGLPHWQYLLLEWQTRFMSNETEDVLSGVGPRLKALRLRRALTLADLAQTTGISVSTLSRLESGQRRPNLELLLPLARAHAVPLDELVGAPATGDPRIHLRPIKRHGQTYVPLGSGSGGLQAFKVVLPGGPALPHPDPQVHEGYEWTYVLRGQLRLVLGERDFILAQGEAAEFDTRTPHWFGRATTESVEFLTLFGPQGERMHVRAAPAKH